MAARPRSRNSKAPPKVEQLIRHVERLERLRQAAGSFHGNVLTITDELGILADQVFNHDRAMSYALKHIKTLLLTERAVLMTIMRETPTTVEVEAA
jgi:hypothetical protein